MDDLIDNQEALYQKFGTHAEFITKVMHLATTAFYFLQMNKEEKESGKESETTHCLYIFLVGDWLKTILEKLINRRRTQMIKWEASLVLFFL